MSIESDARNKIGILLRGFREKKGWNRGRLAEEIGLKREVVIRLEHGVVNPSRRDFRRVIKALDLTPRARETAGRLLKTIYPRKRIKFHLHVSILRHRNRVYRS